MNTGHLAAKVLADAGVRYAFGLIGSTVADFMDGLADDPRLRVVPARHEQVATHMADATARLTARPTVCFVHGMPGALNAALGLGVAQRDSSPVILVSGDVEQELHGREAWQAFDAAVDVFRPLTKMSCRVTRPEEVERVLRHALVSATSGRPGPVHVQLPRDVSLAPAASDGATTGEITVPFTRPAPDGAAVDEIARRLTAAQRPVVLVGGGVTWSRAETALAAVAERLALPVVVSQTSRGALSETGPLCLGASGRVMGNRAASRAVREADVILAVGCRLSDLQTDEGQLIPPDASLLHVDMDGAQLHHGRPAQSAVVADARAFLDALLAVLPPAPRTADARMRELLAERDAVSAERLTAGSGFGPREVIAAVHAVASPGAVVTIGAGRHAQFAAALPRSEPRTHLKAMGSAAMGFAFPAALAAKVVHPERQSIALAGDGDFLMGVHDLETAVREQLAVVSVIFNDFGYSSQTRPGRKVGVAHGNPDFAAMARSYGALGFTAGGYDELCAALEEALAAHRPAVVDARIRG